MKNLEPKEAKKFLDDNPGALFIDCRSDAEHFFVGEVQRLAGHSKQRAVVLICRSGNRSLDAGQALESAGFTVVYNVLHGFEGELDEKHHRSASNGWRHDELPWQQL